jgi:PTS system galactitol-specific IIA component
VTGPRRDGAVVSLVPVPELSVLDLPASTWLDVLHELGARAVAAGHAAPAFTDALVERERHAPTGLPTAVPVAIPHVDPPSVLRSGIGLARLARPVPWGEMGAPGRQVDVVAVLVLLVGESHAHVDLLSRLMQVLQGDDWYTELRAAADVESACRGFARRLHVS